MHQKGNIIKTPLLATKSMVRFECNYICENLHSFEVIGITIRYSLINMMTEVPKTECSGVGLFQLEERDEEKKSTKSKALRVKRAKRKTPTAKCKA